MEVENDIENENEIQRQIELEEQEQLDEEMIIRARKWQQKRVKKFKQEVKGTLVNMQSIEMPVDCKRSW